MATRAGGSSKINGVAIGETTINLLGPAVLINATYALVNVDNGDKYGRGTRTGPWSEGTHQALLQLLAHMEQDICGDCFDVGELASSDDSETQAIGDGAMADVPPADESEIPGL